MFSFSIQLPSPPYKSTDKEKWDVNMGEGIPGAQGPLAQMHRVPEKMESKVCNPQPDEW